MKLPRYTATTPPPRSSGLVRVTDTDINALVRTSDIEKWQAVGELGQGLDFAGQLAFKASQNRRALDDEIEVGLFTQKAQDRISLGEKEAKAYDFTNNLPQPGDADYYTTVKNYSTDGRDRLTDKNFGSVEEDIKKQIAGIKSPKVKAEAEAWYLKNSTATRNRISHEYGVNHENWQITQMTKMMESAAENGNIDIADGIADKMDEFNLATPQRAEILKKNNKVIADTNITYYSARAVMADKGRQEAVKHIMAQDIDVDIKKDIVSKINFEAAQQRDRLEIQQEKDRDEISKLIRSGQSATARIESSYLDEKEQWTWFERERAEAERLAKGEDIVSDIQLEGELEKMAYDIWTGAVSKSQFDHALSKARFGERRIDDSAYDSLKSLSEREHKTYQAGALREAITHAETQLVTVHQSTLETILALLETEQDKIVYENLADQRKQELWNLSQYRKALNDWFAANPEATADELYIASRKLLIHYRRRTLADISRAQEEFEAKLLTVYPKPTTDKKILEAAKKTARLRAGRPRSKEETAKEKALIGEGKKILGALKEPKATKPGQAQGFDEFYKSMPEPLRDIWEELPGDERLMAYRLLAAGVTGEQIAGMTPEERKTVSKLLAGGYSIEKIKEVFNK